MKAKGMFWIGEVELGRSDMIENIVSLLIALLEI